MAESSGTIYSFCGRCGRVHQFNSADVGKRSQCRRCNFVYRIDAFCCTDEGKARQLRRVLHRANWDAEPTPSETERWRASKEFLSAGRAEPAYEISTNLFGKRRVHYECPECDADLVSTLSDAGCEDQCPECEAVFVVPGLLDRYGHENMEEQLAKDAPESLEASVLAMADGAESSEEFSDENNKGIVYILVNESIPNKVKIGMTQRKVSARLRELNSTGIPTEFECYYAAIVEDAAQVERELHDRFADKRKNSKREFFTITPREAHRALARFAIGDATFT